MSIWYKAMGHLSEIKVSHYAKGKTGTAAIGAYLLGVSGLARADGDGSEAIDEIGGLLGDTMALALNVGAAAIFVIAVFAAISMILKAMAGRSTWGEVFGPLLVCALVIAFVAWAVTTGQTKVDAIGTAD